MPMPPYNRIHKGADVLDAISFESLMASNQMLTSGPMALLLYKNTASLSILYNRIIIQLILPYLLQTEVYAIDRSKFKLQRRHSSSFNTH